MKDQARALGTVLVTGGCGFIGSNFIRWLLSRGDFTGRIVNLDVLTYAGNPENLAGLPRGSASRYHFVKADICDRPAIEELFARRGIDTVVHFAAESHVDRSIHGPEAFLRTNVMGTFTLLDVARRAWEGRRDVLFHHVGTDEVYGSLGESGRFTEATPYDPRSPYSASKAAGDHLVSAYHHTYGLPVTLSNSSNNYGPYQFPEKLIPLMILNMLEGKPLPVYGDGKNVRDWLYVEDHCAAIWAVVRGGAPGEAYNAGGGNEVENIALIGRLMELVAEESGRNRDDLRRLVTYVKDRPGHDRRYAIDSSKLEGELGWKPTVALDEGLRRTVRWYLANRAWTERVRSGDYRKWIETNYDDR